ncbi:MAG: hypothetical protein F6K19_28150 [Cyanothece sp. SIO1E1]|nr:hypothetical protein [Cyanothece sp. SIO1E1]
MVLLPYIKRFDYLPPTTATATAAAAAPTPAALALLRYSITHTLPKRRCQVILQIF